MGHSVGNEISVSRLLVASVLACSPSGVGIWKRWLLRVAGCLKQTTIFAWNRCMRRFSWGAIDSGNLLVGHVLHQALHPELPLFLADASGLAALRGSEARQARAGKVLPSPLICWCRAAFQVQKRWKHRRSRPNATKKVRSLRVDTSLSCVAKVEHGIYIKILL